MPNFVWLPGAARYYDRDIHRFVSFAQVDEWIGQSIAVTENKADALSSMIGEGQINVPDWQGQMREQIKLETVRQYLAGKGGIDQMTQADWGSIGGMCADQYRYLDGFAQEIAAGTLTEGQIRARSAMYIRSSREAYERAKERTLAGKGIEEERWVLGIAEHCEDCVNFSLQGWQPLGAFPYPGEGETICLTNCQCHKVYRTATGQTFGE